MYKLLNNSNLNRLALLSSLFIIILAGCGGPPSSTISSGSIASSSISTSSGRTAAATTLATSSLGLGTAPITCGACGDVNSDGAVNVVDALLAAQIAASIFTPTPCQQINADVDGNGVVTVLDALRIANPIHHSSFRCRQAPVTGSGGGVVIGPVTPGGATLGSAAPDPIQACQDLWLEEPFVSGSIQDNTVQLTDISGTLLDTFHVDYVSYVRNYFELSAVGILILVRNWTGNITSRTSGKAAFQSFPHRAFEVPRGNNAFYAGTPYLDLRSANAPIMNEWSVVCGYEELVIGKLYWVNSSGETRVGYFVKLWYTP